MNTFDSSPYVFRFIFLATTMHVKHRVQMIKLRRKNGKVAPRELTEPSPTKLKEVQPDATSPIVSKLKTSNPKVYQLGWRSGSAESCAADDDAAMVHTSPTQLAQLSSDDQRTDGQPHKA